MEDTVTETTQDPVCELVRINFNCPTNLRDAFQAEAASQGRGVGSLLEQLMLEYLQHRVTALDLMGLDMLPDWIKRQVVALPAGEDRPMAIPEVRPAQGKPLNEPVERHEGVSSRLL